MEGERERVRVSEKYIFYKMHFYSRKWRNNCEREHFRVVKVILFTL